MEQLLLSSYENNGVSVLIKIRFVKELVMSELPIVLYLPTTIIYTVHFAKAI
jgi:hypothetical protein